MVFNIIALLKRIDPAMPSDRFRKLIRMNLARQLATDNTLNHGRLD